MATDFAAAIKQAKTQAQLAYDKYHAVFDKAFYNAAIQGKSTGHANALIDMALCLCGHPAFETRYWPWGEAGITFLSQFGEVKGVGSLCDKCGGSIRGVSHTRSQSGSGSWWLECSICGRRY